MGWGGEARQKQPIEVVGWEPLKNCSKVKQNKSINANTNCNKRDRGRETSNQVKKMMQNRIAHYLLTEAHPFPPASHLLVYLLIGRVWETEKSLIQGKHYSETTRNINVLSMLSSYWIQNTALLGKKLTVPAETRTARFQKAAESKKTSWRQKICLCPLNTKESLLVWEALEVKLLDAAGYLAK